MKIETSLIQQQIMKLAPQVIQSIEILQLPTMALIERVSNELEENPFLEVEEISTSPDDKNLNEEGDESGSQDNGNIDNLSNTDDEWNDYYEQTYRKSSSYDEFDKKQQAIENTAAKRVSLHEHLLEQLSLLTLHEDIEEICENIIYNIDKNGYLPCPFEEIIEFFGNKITLDDVSIALSIVQGMEPPGVGARDLKECLLLQLDKKDKHYDLAKRLILHHLEDIESKKYQHIANKTSYDLKTIKEVINSISMLNPKPGTLFDAEVIPYVIPEVRIELVDGKYEVVLLNNNIPQVYINDFYSKVLNRKDAEPEAYEHLKKKINSAKWLVDALEQRRHTLLKVTEKIVSLQKEFLDEGILHLRPLKMQEVADEIGMHVSTVSRAIAHKYAQTPQGTYELKYFFPSGFKTNNGTMKSDETTRQLIADIIENEDKKNPLSDEDIMKIVNKKGIDIARRTVTKFRRMMNIPSSRQRRELI